MIKTASIFLLIFVLATLLSLNVGPSVNVSGNNLYAQEEPDGDNNQTGTDEPDGGNNDGEQ